MAKKVKYKGEEHTVLSSHKFGERDFHVLEGIGSVLTSQCEEIKTKTVSKIIKPSGNPED